MEREICTRSCLRWLGACRHWTPTQIARDIGRRSIHEGNWRQISRRQDVSSDHAGRLQKTPSRRGGTRWQRVHQMLDIILEKFVGTVCPEAERKLSESPVPGGESKSGAGFRERKAPTTRGVWTKFLPRRISPTNNRVKNTCMHMGGYDYINNMVKT